MRAGAVPVGVLVSGRGTNLQALLDACAAPDYPARIAVVISDRPGAPALERARKRGIPALVVDARAAPTRDAFEARLVEHLRAHDVQWVCLAGFMRVLGERFLEAFPMRVLNIHPSLLPAFPGLHAQRRAWEHGVKVAGCTVHFVTRGVDEGPIVAQAAVPVYDDDTPETLAARILAEEHRVYPLALRWAVEGRCRIVGRRVRIVPEVVRRAGG